MGVIMTNMDMPDNCVTCDFKVATVGTIFCRETGSQIGVTCACYERMKDCPLRSVEGLIEKIKKASFEHYFELGEYIGENTQRVSIIATDRVIEIIKEYCEVEK